jgi:hypothetical protein
LLDGKGTGGGILGGTGGGIEKEECDGARLLAVVLTLIVALLSDTPTDTLFAFCGAVPTVVEGVDVGTVMKADSAKFASSFIMFSSASCNNLSTTDAVFSGWGTTIASTTGSLIPTVGFAVVPLTKREADDPI